MDGLINLSTLGNRKDWGSNQKTLAQVSSPYSYKYLINFKATICVNWSFQSLALTRQSWQQTLRQM